MTNKNIIPRTCRYYNKYEDQKSHRNYTSSMNQREREGGRGERKRDRSRENQYNEDKKAIYIGTFVSSINRSTVSQQKTQRNQNDINDRDIPLSLMCTVRLIILLLHYIMQDTRFKHKCASAYSHAHIWSTIHPEFN